MRSPPNATITTSTRSSTAGQSATHPGLTHRNVEAESICDVQLSYPPWAIAASSNARTVV